MGLHLSGGSGGGGTATTDASALTSGTLAIARIADGSVTDAKLASGASGSKPLTRTARKTANYTAAMWDLIPCDTSGGAFTVTLPAASGSKGRVAIKLVTAGNTLSLALTGSDHFNSSTGATAGTLTLVNQGIIVESDGVSVWTVTADDVPLSGLDTRYVAPTLVDAKGDLFVGTANDTLARLAVGTDGYALVADSTQTTGLSWVIPRARVAAEAHADTTVVNTTTETDLVSIALPTTLAAGDLVRLTAWADALNNTGSAVTYTWRLKIGTTTAIATPAQSIATSATRSRLRVTVDILVSSTTSQLVSGLIYGNRGPDTWAASASIISGGYAVGQGTAAEDLTSAKTLKLTMQLGTANALADYVNHAAVLEIVKKA